MTVPKQLRPGLAVLCTAAVLLAGCGGGGPDPTTAPDQVPLDLVWPDEHGAPIAHRAGCDALSEDAARGGSFMVAVADSVRPPRAPLPTNDAERLVFAQLYEALVRVACDGSLAPGLAVAWECDDSAAVWTFTLREDARLWDGTTVTAQVVDEAWRRNRSLPGVPTRLDLLPLQVRVLDEQHLEIRPARPNRSLPRLLAHPAWAVALVRPGWTWPVGSGPARLRASTPPPLPEIVCRPNPQHPRAPRWKSLVFVTRPGGDVRDLVALDADLLMVRGRAGVDFYRELADYRVTPLPWDRLHLLVAPRGFDQEELGHLRAAATALDPTRDLTAASTAPWPYPTLPGGPVTRAPVGRIDPLPRESRLDSDLAAARLDAQTVVHDRDDPVAAELAGRLTALAGSGVRTVGLARTDAVTALQWSAAGAGVLTVRPTLADPALQLADLAGRFAWLGRAVLAGPRSSVPGDSTLDRIIPLAVSRPWLVTRGALTGVEVGGDGTILLWGLGAAATEAVP